MGRSLPAAPRGIETHESQESELPHPPSQPNCQPNGFTLMELLIVMAIIVILTLLAIPTVGAFRRSANKISAIKSIQAIQMARDACMRRTIQPMAMPARWPPWAAIPAPALPRQPPRSS